MFRLERIAPPAGGERRRVPAIYDGSSFRTLRRSRQIRQAKNRSAGARFGFLLVESGGVDGPNFAHRWIASSEAVGPASIRKSQPACWSFAFENDHSKTTSLPAGGVDGI